MIFLPHTNTVILLEPYCGTITEPGLPVLSGVFPRLSATFLSGRGNLKENYVTLFTKFDWSVISSSLSKYGTFENE